ncbi:MAG TPA: hypothetical protein VNK04_18845 [Gemmataceae bacterium]|jgi:hypothetical protein|nr:hypothetical protein [Gemmataceae bacterium]
MIRTRFGRHLFALLAALAGLAAAASAGRACQPEQVRVTVVVILATDQNDKVCPTLECLAKEVRKKRPELTGFRQGNQTCKSMTVGKEETFELLEGQCAAVVVQHGANAHNWVCLKVHAPGVGDIVYRSVCGKFFPIVTGYQTKKNETLILAIRVEPCKKP